MWRWGKTSTRKHRGAVVTWYVLLPIISSDYYGSSTLVAATAKAAAGHPPLTEDVREPGHVHLDDLPAGDHGVPGASCGRASRLSRPASGPSWSAMLLLLFQQALLPLQLVDGEGLRCWLVHRGCNLCCVSPSNCVARRSSRGL